MIRFYLSGNPAHDRVIEAFYAGCPEDKILVEDWHYEPSDLAVIFGIGKKKVPVSWPRGKVFSQQRDNNLDVVVLETGYINRGDGENHHYAAGINGLNGRAYFNNSKCPPDRFMKLGVEIKPYQRGNHIVLCGQVPWDASVDHVDFLSWLGWSSQVLSSLTARKIIFRPHPMAGLPPIDGCEYSLRPLSQDLKDAWALVAFNSNSTVEALLEGVPVFVSDEGAMTYHVGNKVLSRIESPQYFDREQWAYDLAYCQWTPQEMREGLAWKHLFP